MFYLQGGYKSLAQKLICAHSVLLLVWENNESINFRFS
jgi:hypothetical protein